MADSALWVFEVEIAVEAIVPDPVIDGGSGEMPVLLAGELETTTRGLIAGSLETPTLLAGELETTTRGLIAGNLEMPIVLAGNLEVVQ